MQKYFLILVAIMGCCALSASMLKNPAPYDLNTPVSSVLMALGEDAPEHYIGTINMEKVSIGKDLVILGGPYADGNTSYRISEHFVCVDCHNIQPETWFAGDNDPENRLKYAMENNQPYLPGSTLYGITDRTSWFNGDHEKKYGKELIAPARYDLRAAVQLCSKECSVGRELTEEEMEGVLHFLSTMELKLKDLGLSDRELAQISANGQTEDEKVANIRLIRSKFIQGYPATFAEAIPVKTRKMGEKGNLENGRWIFEKSCLHCHAPDKTVTDRTIFGSGEGQKNFDWLVKYFKKNNGGSVYWITRHGTESKEKTPQYMPVYSKEKLSDEQIEDLAAYVLAESRKE